MNRANKAYAWKDPVEKVWTDNTWTVQFGKLVSHGRPRKGQGPLFSAVGEKLPFEGLDSIRKHFEEWGIFGDGVYIAHDSMGSARYIGRGNIFGELRIQRDAHPLELQYFSFYVVPNKQHEREIETLLIRAAGPELVFNERKKRVGIRTGNLHDYEAGTLYYERQGKRGRRGNGF